MKNRVLLPLLLLLSLSSCSFSKLNQAHALIDEENFIVQIGDQIEVAPRELEHNGQKKTVEGQIIFPDGSSKSGRSFIITMPGVYTVNYRAIFGTDEVNIPIYYHCHRTSGDLFLSSESNNKPQIGEYSFNTKTTKIQGAKLKLDSNTVFTYDGVIDFNTFSFNNPFLEFIVDTSLQGESDLESFTVRLTDAENDNNYVDLSITDSGPIDDDGKGCYILAGSNSQFKTGYEGTRLHTSNYGTNVASSFRALPADNPAKAAQLFLNYPERALYVNPAYGTQDKRVITDLDDRGIYGSMIWEGFTSGKAKLSIFANSLSSAYANLIVSKVNNIDLSVLDFEDLQAPVINIDYAGQEESSIPNASVNKPYKIFEAEIIDNFDRNLPYATYVTYFDSVNGVNKDISVNNGTFTPKAPGEYTITYIAKDYSNNKATKTIKVIAVNDSQSMTMTLPVNNITQLIYSNFVLPSIDEVNITGGSGKANVVRRIENSNGEEVIVLGDIFVPTEIGTYYAKYTATDYIGNIATATLTLVAQKPENPIFIGDVLLPRVLIKGHHYSLPSYDGVEVVSNKTVLLQSDIYVNDVKLTDGTFVAGEDCHVKYKLTGQTGEKEYLKDIDVIDVMGVDGDNNKLDKAKYFHGGFTALEEEKYVSLTAGSGDVSALFASVLPYNNPVIRFSINRDALDIDELAFKLSDSQNPNISLTFHVTFDATKTYVSIGNSGVKYEFANEIDGENEIYELNYINSLRVLQDTDHKELSLIKSDDNGQPFNGFNHGLYLDISMTGVHSTSQLKMLSLANQVLGHRKEYSDFAQPVIILNDAFYSEQDYGEVGVIPAVDFFDVLSDVSATVTVRGPDGKNRLVDADARVPHTFNLDAFGSYLVSYKAVDALNNKNTFSKQIFVYDYIPPELTVNNNLKASYSINSAISIPSYTVSDNLNTYTLDVFLILPNHEQRLLITDENGEVTSYLDADNAVYNSSFKVNSNTFRAEQYGRYILRYVAYDSDYNKTVKELTFEVK